MILRYAHFWYFRWGPANSLSSIFCVWFSNKNAPNVIFYWLSKFHCPVAFIYWGIGQYVYCNCLLTRLSQNKFQNKPDLPNQVVFIHHQKAKTKTWIYCERKELLRWNKKRFSSLLKGFQLPKIVSDLKVRL